MLRAVGGGALAASVANVLQKTAIPFIIAPTGTMANNGAITLGTALPSTYANAYIYLPAGAVAAGVPAAAAWLFCQMSSATVGTVFNNAYTTGVPTIPTSPTAFATTGPGAYTGVTTAVTGPQITIPANTLGANGTLRIFSLWTNPSTAGNKTDAVSVGGTTVYSAGLGTGATSNAVSTEIICRGSQAAQVAPSSNNSGYQFNGNANQYLTINFALAQIVAFVGTVATATDFIVLEGYGIEVMP